VRIVRANFAANGMNVDEFCNRAASCTGTLIAKNWVLTAAHCLGAAGLKQSVLDNIPDITRGWPYCENGDAGQPNLPDAPSPDSGVALNGEADWILEFASNYPPNYLTCQTLPGGCSSKVYSPLALPALQFQYPTYDDTLKYTEIQMDLGLLYFPSWNNVETMLPADISAGSAVSIAATTNDAPDPDIAFFIAGQGVNPGNADAGLPGSGVLEIASAPTDLWWPDTHASAVVRDNQWTQSGHATICHGDSGGPLFTTIANEGATPTIVEYAVAEGASPPDGVDAGSVCPPPVNYSQWWTRLEYDDDVISWINEKKALMLEGPCVKVPSTDDDIGSVWQCWGAPCGGPNNLQCPNGYRCSRSGAELDAAQVTCQSWVCPNGNTSCGCVVGHCVPNPDEGADAAASDNDNDNDNDNDVNRPEFPGGTNS